MDGIRKFCIGSCLWNSMPWVISGWKISILHGYLQWILLFYISAPEVLAVYPYGHTADWWSLGILMYAMLVGKVSYKSVCYMTGENPVSWLAQFVFINLYVSWKLVLTGLEGDIGWKPAQTSFQKVIHSHKLLSGHLAIPKFWQHFKSFLTSFNFMFWHIVLRDVIQKIIPWCFTWN